MVCRRVLILLFALSSCAALSCAQQLPAGTVLPVMLHTTLDSQHDKPGKVISGEIMQDVRVSDGMVIPRRTRLLGRVTASSPGENGASSRISFVFDQLELKGRTVALRTHLRALASMGQVFEAQMPTNSIDDYGTSESDWNTIQIGGAGVFRGSGEVVADGAVVGSTTDYGAVTAKLAPAGKRGCTGESEQTQALWLFSPSACGVYGFEDLKVSHTGNAAPNGEITLESDRRIHISGGSGWLLRVDAAQP
jgi:hypothetical protein